MGGGMESRRAHHPRYVHMYVGFCVQFQGENVWVGARPPPPVN